MVRLPGMARAGPRWLGLELGRIEPIRRRRLERVELFGKPEESAGGGRLPCGREERLGTLAIAWPVDRQEAASKLMLRVRERGARAHTAVHLQRSLEVAKHAVDISGGHREEGEVAMRRPEAARREDDDVAVRER